MEATVLNSIIFGTLQPWQKINQSEQTLSDLLQITGTNVPVTVAELNTKLQILLRDHPGLYKPFSPNSKESLPTAFYHLSLPDYFNTITEYYSLLIQCGELHYLYQLQESIDNTSHFTEAYYFTNTALKTIKYIAAGSASELKRQGFSGAANYSPGTDITADEAIKRNTHFVLYTTKCIAFKLFFEMQTRFADYVKTIETEKQFYLHTFQEPYPANSPISFTAHYFDWKANKVITADGSSIQDTLQLLTELKGNNIPATAISALENKIVSKIFELELQDPTLANLANTATSANLFEQVKQNLLKEINQLTYGHQRLDIINQALNKTHIEVAAVPTSALGQLQQWLSMQADAYKGSLSSSFAVEPDTGQELRKKLKPLPRNNKTTTEDLKRQAQEFLKHFSGHNVQQQKIMSEADYNRLLQYTFHLIEHEKLPKDLKQIQTIELSGNHIRYTYYQMHKAFYGTNEIKTVWINFLQQVFQKLSSQDWQTLKTKFSAKPSKYEHDIKSMAS